MRLQLYPDHNLGPPSNPIATAADLLYFTREPMKHHPERLLPIIKRPVYYVSQAISAQSTCSFPLFLETLPLSDHLPYPICHNNSAA